MDNIDNIKVLQECKSTKTAVFEALRVMEVKVLDFSLLGMHLTIFNSLRT